MPAAAERAFDTDGHGQIIGRGEGGGDPAPTEAYVGESEWPDPMPAGPIEAKPYQGMTAMQQLRTRGFAHFSNVFTPEFIEELRLFIDEGEQGVSKYYPEGTSDFSRPSGEGNVFQGDQLSMSFREEAKDAPTMACGSALARLVAWPRSIEALGRCGVEKPKLWAGYILSKGAGGPPLYWHRAPPVPFSPSSRSSHSPLRRRGLALLERRGADQGGDGLPALRHDLPLQNPSPRPHPQHSPLAPVVRRI